MDIFLRDPILLTATAVFIATIVILAWLLNAWRGKAPSIPEEFNEEENFFQPKETLQSSGLLEAHLQEISNQLGRINERLDSLEKLSAVSRSSDQTQQLSGMPTIPDLERMTKRLESKIENLQSSTSGALLTPGMGSDDSIKRLEGKLEGIHKLLIILTDSGSISERK